MKKTKLVATGLALTLALSACGANNNSSSSAGKTGLRASDKPYMTINDDKISNKDFYAQYDLFAGVFAIQQGVGESVKNMMQRDYVISKDIEKNKIKISEDDYKKALEDAITSMGGKEKYDEYLNYMGTTKEVFEQNIKFNLNNQKHAEWFAKKNQPKDADIKAYYEQQKGQLDTIDTKHILVKDEKTAKEVYEKLKKGEDFKALSDKYSIDDAAKAQGGELGSMPIGNLDKAYTDAAVKLEKGKFSEPVKSSFGYHIIQLNDKKVGIEGNKDAIIKALSQQDHENYLAEQIGKLKVKQFDINGKEVKNEKPQVPGSEPTQGGEDSKKAPAKN